MPIIQTAATQAHKNAGTDRESLTFRSSGSSPPSNSHKISDDEMASKIVQMADEGYAPTTYLPPDKFNFNLKNNKNEVVEEVSYNLSLPQKIFLFLELPDCCILAQYSSYVMMLTIAVSCVCFVLSSVDNFRHTPSTCDNPACENDAVLCPNKTICEPVEDDYFFIFETCCVIIFTLDYALRMMTVSSVPPRLAHLLPQHIKHQAPDQPKIPDPEYSWYYKLWAYGTKPFNIIDAVAIIPYYLSFGLDVGSGFVILRVLRLIRVFRILKSKNVRTGLKIIQKALMASVPALSILSFLTVLLVLLFGSLIYFCEGGDFTVNADFPEGAYIRWNVDWSEKEQSPFSSILLSIYWAIVTATTVGYGDFYPTTSLGRITAICLMYMGIVAIALPISIVGSNFDREYQLVHHNPEENEVEYTGTKSERRKEMIKHMHEMTTAMNEISARLEIIGMELMKDGENEDEELTLSFSAPKVFQEHKENEFESSSVTNGIMEMSEK